MCVSVWQFGFRKWKSHVTERPFEDRSEVVKELYSELTYIKPHAGINVCDKGSFPLSKWGLVLLNAVASSQSRNRMGTKKQHTHIDCKISETAVLHRWLLATAIGDMWLKLRK